MVKLTNSQLEFLRKIRNQEAIPRTLTNQTATALKNKGILSYRMMVGWTLTPFGAVVIGQYKGALDALDEQL